MKNLKTSLLSFTLLALASCGSDDASMIRDIVYEIDEEQLEVGVEFEDLIEIELEASIPIKDYGTLNFRPAGRTKGSILSFSLQTDILEDDEILRLKKTRKLPNGIRMSSYVESDLLWLRLEEDLAAKPSLYLGTSVDDFYVGAGLQFDFMDEDFPEYLTISSRFRDAKGRLVGVLTFFGPSLKRDGSVKEHGGIFFATHANDLKKYSDEDRGVRPRGLTADPIEIRKNGELYAMKDREKYYLFKKLQKELKKFNKEQKRNRLK